MDNRRHLWKGQMLEGGAYILLLQRFFGLRQIALFYQKLEPLANAIVWDVRLPINGIYGQKEGWHTLPLGTLSRGTLSLGTLAMGYTPLG